MSSVQHSRLDLLVNQQSIQSPDCTAEARMATQIPAAGVRPLLQCRYHAIEQCIFTDQVVPFKGSSSNRDERHREGSSLLVVFPIQNSSIAVWRVRRSASAHPHPASLANCSPTRSTPCTSHQKRRTHLSSSTRSPSPIYYRPATPPNVLATSSPQRTSRRSPHEFDHWMEINRKTVTEDGSIGRTFIG